MAYSGLDEILTRCKQENLSFAEAIIREEINDHGLSREALFSQMELMWNAMIDADKHYDPNLLSNSKLVGGAGGKMDAYLKAGDSLSGPVIGAVIMRALQTGESNACMKRIVAAPTAGSSGVLPAVLITCNETFGFSKDEILEALFVAAGIGQVIATRAYIAGASGGCQAEIGAASAMAAGALISLKKGTNEQILEAVAISLKNLLGLVCDPVAGLVEVPCVKRNVIGSVNAMSAADMVLAEITSAIPADQVIDALKEIGDMMHSDLKETGQGGLAITKFGKEFVKNLR